MNNINIEDLYKVIEEMKKKIDHFEIEHQKDHQKIQILEEQLKEKDQELHNLKKTVEVLYKELEVHNIKDNHFQNKILAYGVQKGWFQKSSMEYKEYDAETLQELIKKYHLNITEEPIKPASKVNPYSQVIKFCYENHYEKLYRNEIESLLHVKNKTARRIMKELENKNPLLFKVIQDEKYTKNSMSYLQILSKKRLEDIYKGRF